MLSFTQIFQYSSVLEVVWLCLELMVLLKPPVCSILHTAMMSEVEAGYQEMLCFF